MTTFGMSYRTGQCIVGNHPLCGWAGCTCACHQPAQPPGERSRGASRGDEAAPAVADAPGAVQRLPAEEWERTKRIKIKDPNGWRNAGVGWDGTVTVVLSVEDFRFVTEYDPDRERSASRRDMATVLEEIQALLRDNRVEP